jgi:hypothetical protein
MTKAEGYKDALLIGVTGCDGFGLFWTTDIKPRSFEEIFWNKQECTWYYPSGGGLGGCCFCHSTTQGSIGHGSDDSSSIHSLIYRPFKPKSVAVASSILFTPVGAGTLVDHCHVFTLTKLCQMESICSSITIPELFPWLVDVAWEGLI